MLLRDRRRTGRCRRPPSRHEASEQWHGYAASTSRRAPRRDRCADCASRRVNGDGAAGRAPARAVASPHRSRRAARASRAAAATPITCCSFADGLLRLLDPLRRLGDAQRHELGAELVEVAAAGCLLGDLAERRDRDRVAHVTPVVTGEPSSSTRDPGARAVVRPRRRTGSARRPGVGSAASTAADGAASRRRPRPPRSAPGRRPGATVPG